MTEEQWNEVLKQAEIESLRTRYGVAHPRMVALQTEIDQLRTMVGILPGIGPSSGVALLIPITATVTGKLAPEWDEPSLFWTTPDKNDHAPALSPGT